MRSTGLNLHIQCPATEPLRSNEALRVRPRSIFRKRQSHSSSFCNHGEYVTTWMNGLRAKARVIDGEGLDETLFPLAARLQPAGPNATTIMARITGREGLDATSLPASHPLTLPVYASSIAILGTYTVGDEDTAGLVSLVPLLVRDYLDFTANMRKGEVNLRAGPDMTAKMVFEYFGRRELLPKLKFECMCV